MDYRERVLAVIALGVIAGSLFAAFLGSRKRGWSYGLICGCVAGVLVTLVLLPIWGGLLGIMPRLS